MRTHYDSIISIYKLNQESNIRELIAENVLAKLERKNVSRINNFGDRTTQSEDVVYIDRKTIKEISMSVFEEGEFLIHRTKAYRTDVDEYYHSQGATSLEAKSLTIGMPVVKTTSATDTNRSSFNSI